MIGIKQTILGAAAGTLLFGLAGGAVAAEPQVITLTQVGCQFVESENGVDHKYTPKKADDCNAINAKTGSGRVAKAATLR